jgi:hypothetical protein
METRLYCPSDIDQAYAKIRIGQRLKIEYIAETYWTQKVSDCRKKGAGRVRKGSVIAKNYAGAQSTFTVEVEPEKEVGKCGRYKLTFQFVDMLIGAIRVWEVGG